MVIAPREALTAIWRDAGMPPDALGQVVLSGADPVLPSSFAVGTAAQATIAAATLAAAEIWRLRSGERRGVSVDMNHAAAEFRSERYLRVDGEPPPSPWDPIAGAYLCADGWVRIHTNFPHHRDGILELLGCANEREAVAQALAGWQASAFERVAAERGLIAAALRTPEAWRDHPQGRALACEPLVCLEKIGEAPPEPFAPAARPLAGLRVLDLTRIIAGPVCGRALAAHGAEVLRVTGPDLPSIPALVMDTGRGKRGCHVDLKDPRGRETLRNLVTEADVLVQGYRPGALAAKGFAPERLAVFRPGIVSASLAAYGHGGPWAGRRGFDSIVQTACGLNHQEAAASGVEGPKALPCQALDHASGYLLAFGTLAALRRRATEGGSWHVRVSLARTARWLEGLGRLPDGFDCPDPGQDQVAEFLEESQSGFGRLTAVRHAGRIEGHAPHWAAPAMPLGSDPAEWPA
ncbi:MAG: CoA transferase [Pseudomonadota bacterium]